MQITGYSNYLATKEGKIMNNTTKKTLKATPKNGYLSVQLKNDNSREFDTLSVNRIIAQTYLENTNNYPLVNHKNGNKLDNNVDNLEWSTQKQNIDHALKHNLIKPHKRAVLQYDLECKFLKEFASVQEAAKSIGLSRHSITAVCCGKNYTAGGFVWKYMTEKKTNAPENYKEIEGYPNYLITPSGNVYSSSQKIFLKNMKNESGYYYVTLCFKKEKSNYYVHRLVAQHYIKNPEKKEYVNHMDCDKGNNNVNNLEWITHPDNVKHMYEMKAKKAVQSQVIKEI